MALFFDTFRRRTVVRGVIRCLTALRVGGTKSMSAVGTDLPVLRTAAGLPVIPGASIKGVVRSQVEAVLRAWSDDLATDPLRERKDLRETPAEKDEKNADVRDRKRRERVEANADAAGKIFGMPDLASHVLFADALPIDAARVEVRDGVALDRDLGRVSGSLKYDYEVVAAGTRFGLTVTMIDLDDAFEGAVVTGLDLLHEGFARLGGFKSRGLGLVQLEDMTVTVLEGAALERRNPAWEKYRAERLMHFSEWRSVQPRREPV